MLFIKKRIEDFIKTNAASFYIFRVSNLVGKSSNPNTILNYLFNCIRNNIEFNLWTNAYRNLIDIDDGYNIINEIIQTGVLKNTIINIANTQSYKVTAIVEAIELFCKKKAVYIKVDKGNYFFIDTNQIIPIIEKLDIRFTNNYYLALLLDKYYSK